MTDKKTILVVDDDEDFLLQQKLQLEAAGYAVLTADGIGAAQLVLADAKPDCAVIDLMMEDQDAGFTLSYHMKKQYPQMPVIMVTGVTAETGMEFDAETGEERKWIKADALLNKPIRFEQLEKEISRLL